MLEVIIEKKNKNKKVKTKLTFCNEKDFELYLRTLKKGLRIQYKIISTNYLLKF